MTGNPIEDEIAKFHQFWGGIWIETVNSFFGKLGRESFKVFMAQLAGQSKIASDAGQGPPMFPGLPLPPPPPPPFPDPFAHLRGGTP